MPKGYVIVIEDIHDPAGMAEYSKRSGTSLRDHGGKVLAVDEQVDVLEGQWQGKKTVILEFATVSDAQSWYKSDSYQSAVPFRQAAADCQVVIVSGLDLPGAQSS